MKESFGARHKRAFSLGLLLILQLLIFLLIIVKFSSYFVYFYWFGILISIVCAIFIANNKSKPPYKIAWIVPILIFPLFGGIAYFLMNDSMHHDEEEEKKRHEKLALHLDHAAKPEDLRKLGVDIAQQSQYMESQGIYPPYEHTETEYYPTGEAFFPSYIEELKKAKHYIFLEYFIISEGVIWSKILDVLKEKAAQGVDVRVVYDGFGSLMTLPTNYPQELEKWGIKCAVFRPMRPILSTRQNSRDHRKITVIDGLVGFNGGINIADEYVNVVERFGYWKDTAILLRGEAVWSLTLMFLQIWEQLFFIEENYESYRPSYYPIPKGDWGFVQPYCDSPAPTDTLCADLHMQMFAKAKWYLYISTPYLVLDDSLASVLQITAKSGVDVRIMCPHIPDKKTVFSVTQSHYEPLLKAGVRIYEFLPGFIHSKTLVADDLYASVGSCNMDYRSFYLQFENGTWLCGSKTVHSIREDFLANLLLCKEITLADTKNTPLHKRIYRAILRLLSPLL